MFIILCASYGDVVVVCVSCVVFCVVACLFFSLLLFVLSPSALDLVLFSFFSSCYSFVVVFVGFV